MEELKQEHWNLDAYGDDVISNLCNLDINESLDVVGVHRQSDVYTKPITMTLAIGYKRIRYGSNEGAMLDEEIVEFCKTFGLELRNIYRHVSQCCN